MSHHQSPRDRDVVIISAVRTPLCRARKGKLANIPPATLLTTVLKGCLQRAQFRGSSNNDDTNYTSIDPSVVQDICVGNVLAQQAALMARMAQLAAGIPHTVPLSTVNRQCSSGLQAFMNIAHAIQSGSIDVGIGAGVESMSANSMKEAAKQKPGVDWESDEIVNNSEVMDCLIPMGITSENVSKAFGLQRKKLDAFAAESHAKAALARKSGVFQREIVKVGDVVEDDGIREGTTVDNLAKLKPVFDPQDGSTTAGNSSQMTDGAAAILLMSRQEAQKRNLKVLGVLKSFSVKGVNPKIMGIGPAVAIPAALKTANCSINDIEVFEINEAFASQASWCASVLNINPKKLNPNGGAIAIGHPLGCTGARQIATLLHELNRKKKNRLTTAAGSSSSQFGVVSMCIGTGMGAAAVFEVEADGDDKNSSSETFGFSKL